LFILHIFGEKYKWNSSLCNILHPLIISSLSGPVFSSAPFPEIPLVYTLLLMSETKFHTHKKLQVKQ
jgi:hypothetical protein